MLNRHRHRASLHHQGPQSWFLFFWLCTRSIHPPSWVLGIAATGAPHSLGAITLLCVSSLPTFQAQGLPATRRQLAGMLPTTRGDSSHTSIWLLPDLPCSVIERQESVTNLDIPRYGGHLHRCRPIWPELLLGTVMADHPLQTGVFLRQFAPISTKLLTKKMLFLQSLTTPHH